ncbi:unnamed protein product [Brassicogethes aeneus]|uniref:Ferritin/DPS domain-containing protein n=1 Tax=Brassicogethes aeneus TaxID=1431903 RepID=A0A9P0B8E0_BRAAE|nr:unnamed protein product [Brassicogethes aeneus]
MQNLASNYFSFLQKFSSPKSCELTSTKLYHENLATPKSQKLLEKIFDKPQEYSNQNMDKLVLLSGQKLNCSTANQCEEPKARKGRHGYHQEVENIVNEQIYHEFNAALSYLAIASHFGQTDIALPGCHGYFFNMHLEEHEHALVFFNYQLMRGGQVKLKGIDTPQVSPKGPADAFNTALEMEIFVKEKLIEVFNVAEKHKDLQVQDLITTDFMEEQNKSICELGRLIERSKITDTPLGEYLFDKMIFSAFVKKDGSKLMNKRSLQDTEINLAYK